MTPLAQRIVKELMLPAGKRTFVDDGKILRTMDDVHCFETTQVSEAAMSLIGRDASQDQATKKFSSMSSVTGFLPAPKTWIEPCLSG